MLDPKYRHGVGIPGRVGQQYLLYGSPSRVTEMAVACPLGFFLMRGDVAVSCQVSVEWYALRVKTRHEHRVCNILTQKDVETFLPTYAITRRWSDRVKRVSMPLFPGYVFAHLNISRRLPVLTAPSVIGFVGFGGPPVAVEATIIADLKRVVVSQMNPEPCEYMKVGQRVRICSGSLAGIEGILAQTRQASKLIISVDLLHRSVSVEVPREMVELIESPDNTHRQFHHISGCSSNHIT
jgi:transcription antitermination factor NusG